MKINEERHTHVGEGKNTMHKRRSVSVYLKEIIYGGVDGTITTFAVVAGFSGAALSNETATQLSFMTVLLFGLANLFADGVSMGLGNFLAVRSDQGLYNTIRNEEREQSMRNADAEAEMTRHILIERGFLERDAVTLTEIYRGNDRFWVDFMVENGLDVPDPTGENPLYTGIATFLSFVSFGLIPLIPFIVMGSFDPQTVFQFSGIGALGGLILLGALKWKIVGTNLFKSVGEIVLVGGAAASIAFFVGTLFTF